MKCRLSQFCSIHNICSRVDAKKFISLGMLKVNNSIVNTDILVPFGFKPENIKLFKRALDIQSSKISVLLHKPLGYLSTYSKNCTNWSKNLLTRQNRSENDIQNRLEPYKINDFLPLSPLEANSSGLLIFSQDKTLYTKFSDCEEEFDVVFKDKLTDYKLSFLQGDIYLDGYSVGPLVIKDTYSNSLSISFRGSSQKLRRICLLAGLEIKSLVRTRISNVNLDHPPQNRSNLIKLDNKYNKLMYVTNGKISPKKHEEFLKTAIHYVKKGDEIHTSCLAFAKGGSHELLETLSMDDVYHLEQMIPEINRAFQECEMSEKPKTSKHVPIKY
ncbi:hypothetical protein MACK_001654 [Theileria orientalis]|uniref:RNA-binding S4 domain-containing protein n=1 Tax=Theileria orientalis TaxID=68886 RepID=A0A976MDG1_THEOR|nr:hypothetical protein MACK_001654 [Theileria orientalis]